MILVVIADFGTYKRGDRIVDADEIKRVRESVNAPNVVAVHAQDKRPPKK
ncbi:MAG: hypothetical protein KGL39_32260 [Patescibacteria group bacterium]|nr:hypothetical protein [Patescibacteria group bacterium]